MSEKCKEELFRVELEAADDYRTDFEMNKYCQEDAKHACPDVEPGEGRVQDCLVCPSFRSCRPRMASLSAHGDHELGYEHSRPISS